MITKEKITLTNYFQNHAYHPKEDCCFIVDSNGEYEEPGEFSFYFVNKYLQILEVFQRRQANFGEI